VAAGQSSSRRRRRRRRRADKGGGGRRRRRAPPPCRRGRRGASPHHRAAETRTAATEHRGGGGGGAQRRTPAPAGTGARAVASTAGQRGCGALDGVSDGRGRGHQWRWSQPTRAARASTTQQGSFVRRDNLPKYWILPNFWQSKKVRAPTNKFTSRRHHPVSAIHVDSQWPLARRHWPDQSAVDNDSTATTSTRNCKLGNISCTDAVFLTSSRKCTTLLGVCSACCACCGRAAGRNLYP